MNPFALQSSRPAELLPSECSEERDEIEEYSIVQAHLRAIDSDFDGSVGVLMLHEPERETKADLRFGHSQIVVHPRQPIPRTLNALCKGLSVRCAFQITRQFFTQDAA